MAWATSPDVASAASALVLPGRALWLPSPRTHCSSLGPRPLSAGQEGPWLSTAVCQGPDREGTCSGCQRPPSHLQDYSAATIMHEEVIRAEAEQAGAEMYLASFPLAGRAGPLPPRCAQQSSYRSDQSQSRRGAREMVLGRSLGKINTLQDWCQAAPPTSTPGRRQPRRVSLRRVASPMGQSPEQGSSSWDGRSGLLQALPTFSACSQAWSSPTELRAPPTHPAGPKGNRQDGRAGLGRERPPRAGAHSQVQGGWEACKSHREHHGCLARPGREGSGRSEGCTQCPLNGTDHVTQQLLVARSKVWTISKETRFSSWLTLTWEPWPDDCSAGRGELLFTQILPMCGLSKGRTEWERLPAI